MSEWLSYTPDGREVVIRRTLAGWIVRCGGSRAHSSSLDVALASALRDDADVVAHNLEIDSRWVCNQAAAIEQDRENTFWLDWQSPRASNHVERSTSQTERASRTSQRRGADITDPRD